MSNYENIEDLPLLTGDDDHHKGVFSKFISALRRVKYELSDNRVCEILQKCMDAENDVLLKQSARRG